MRIDRNELIGILGVSNGALKQIIRKSQLEDRLHNKGYKLISTIKEGRKTFYDVEQMDEGDFVEYRNPSYIEHDGFDIEYGSKDSTGIYCIELNDKIYIGKTSYSFRNRFLKHVSHGRSEVKELIDNGGRMRIIHDMTGITDEELYFIIEEEIIRLYEELTDYEIVNSDDGRLKNLSYTKKIKTKSLFKFRVKNSDYDKMAELIKKVAAENNIKLY